MQPPNPLQESVAAAILRKNATASGAQVKGLPPQQRPRQPGRPIALLHACNRAATVACLQQQHRLPAASMHKHSHAQGQKRSGGNPGQGEH